MKIKNLILSLLCILIFVACDSKKDKFLRQEVYGEYPVLKGNYSTKQLNKISKALHDNVLGENELGFFLEKKMQKNNDLYRLYDEVDIQLECSNKTKRDKERQKICNEYSYNYIINRLFHCGDNLYLLGNYSVNQLNKIAKAIEDGSIEKNELNNFLLNKLHNNGDLHRIIYVGTDIWFVIKNLYLGEKYSIRQLCKISKALNDGLLEDGELNSFLLNKLRNNNDLQQMINIGIDVRVAL